MKLSELSKQVSHCIFCGERLILKEGRFDDGKDPYLCPNEDAHEYTAIWAWVNTGTVDKTVQCLNVTTDGMQLHISFEENYTSCFLIGSGHKEHFKFSGCHIPNLDKNTLLNKMKTMMVFS